MTRWFGILVGGAILCGCSSNESAAPAGPDCTAAYPCGGSLIGVWNLSNICLSNVQNPFAVQCPSVTNFQMSATVNGTLEFRADGTYSAGMTTSATDRFSIPTTCLGGLDCAGYQSRLNQLAAAGTATCTGTATGGATGCDCQYTLSQTDSGGGTYTVSGTTVTLTKAGTFTASTRSYCVQGNNLFVQNTATTGTVQTVGATRQ
jgi:hypothetical protein